MKSPTLPTAQVWIVFRSSRYPVEIENNRASETRSGDNESGVEFRFVYFLFHVRDSHKG